MIRKYLFPLLALIGIAVAASIVLVTGNAPPSTEGEVLASEAPYASHIAGAGLIEARTGNIAVGTSVSGIITAMYVKWGDLVHAGDPLFRIDDRDAQARLSVLIARQEEAAIKLARAKDLLRIGEGLTGGFISGEELDKRRFDVASAKAAVRTTQAEREAVTMDLERRTVRAPVTGRILQIYGRLGEFAQGSRGGTPIMVLGDDTRLYVRTDLDENDAWRFRRESAAQAFVRGNPTLSTPLQFERIEPLVVPKRSFTGSSTERTDTRVLQVIYSFDRDALPVFIGQQVDVFIEAPPLDVPHGDVPGGDGHGPSGKGP